MGIIIGIDVGGSTTKIVGFDDNGKIIHPLHVKANDKIASSYGAFGKFTSENNIEIKDIEKIMITGAGSSYMKTGFFGIETQHVGEFDCIGLGGLYLSGFSDAVIVSMGTGTAIVHAKKNGIIQYMGGTGVGGGTLIGLSKKMLGVSHVNNIVELAESGNLDNIDLRIGDISPKDIISALPSQMTASNFGNVSDVATKSDIAKGIMNLIFESIGMLSVFAARSCGLRDIVLTGNLTTVPYTKERFDVLNSMFNMNFVIPKSSQYATVIGAALMNDKKK